MFPFTEMSLRIFDHILYFFANPLVYLAVVIMILQYQKAVNNERKLHSVRVTSVTEQTLVSLGIGLLAGVFVSVVLMVFQIALTAYDIFCIWIVAMLVLIIPNRFVGFPYIIGLLGIVVFITDVWAGGANLPVIGILWIGVEHLDMSSIIAVIAVLQIAEAILIWADGGRKASPVFVKSKRGHVVGGFHMQKIWLLPVFVVLAYQPGTEMNGVLLASIGLGLFPLPIALGYGDLAIAKTPRQKSRMSAGILAIYGVVLFTFTYMVNISPWLLLLAAVFAIGVYEAMIVSGKRNEMLDRPLYTRPEQGIRILAVLPNSTAAKLGLQSGEVIVKVNGMEVNDKTDLYDAIALQSVYIKMEVENLHKEVKFLQTPLYQGEHHSLGMILVPDDDVEKYVTIEK